MVRPGVLPPASKRVYTSEAVASLQIEGIGSGAVDAKSSYMVLDYIASPDSFPVPMAAPYEIAPGRKHSGPSLALSITEAELIDLYNICGRILHSRNPFSTADATHQIGYTVDEWLARLEGLMRWHRIQLVDGAMWLVNMPEIGNVHVTTAVPSNT